MEGVEILNQFEVPIEHCFNGAWFWIGFGIVATVACVVGLWEYFSGECSFAIIPIMIMIGVFGGVLIGVCCGEVAEVPTKYETHYQVTITDEVKMTEFNERYEILDQEGKIYTVREK